jgi:hypothetical protein
MEIQNGYDNEPQTPLQPVLTRRCLWIARALHAAFILAPIWIGLRGWETYGWFYGLLFWLLGNFGLIIGLSKLKLLFVPPEQHEFSHNTATILKWVVFKRFC